MSDNRNGQKNLPQRRSAYQTRSSPYRLKNEADLEDVERRKVGPVKIPRLRLTESKRGSGPGTRDADPNRRILKDRREGEYVIKYYRRSKWHILYLSIIPAILTVITLVALLLSALVPILNIISLPILALAIGWWAYTIIDWANDYLILTNKRFVYIEKIIFFEQTRAEIRTVDFTEVKLESKRGSLEFAFQIGTVVIQGKGGTISFNHLAKPDRVYLEIDNDFKEYRKTRRKERDEFMDNYFASKAHNQPPPRPPYSVDVPAHTLQSNFFARTFGSKPTLSTDEQKRQQLVWHKHVFILLKAEAMPAGLSLLYLIALVFLLPLLLAIGGVLIPIVIAVAIVIAAILAGFIWYQYTGWNNDVYILNTEEVIDSEKLPFGFNEFRDRIKLANVQEIELNKPGVFANFFNYGMVLVSRTGGNRPLTFTNVPNPDAVQMQIGRWKDTRQEIVESMDDERQIDFLIRHRHNLRHMLEDE